MKNCERPEHHELYDALRKYLDFPRYTRKVVITMEVDQAVIIECEYLPKLALNDLGELEIALRAYELTPQRSCLEKFQDFFKS